MREVEEMRYNFYDNRNNLLSAFFKSTIVYNFIECR